MRAELRRRLGEMSPEELAGQLLMLGFSGRAADEAAGVLALKPAGISLLPRNLIDARQTAALARALQAAAVAIGAEPLLIGADQEGGAVTAVAEGTTVFPGAMALGAAGSPGLTRRVALAQGREAAAMGINLNYAPVADLNCNPANPIIGVRSFGDDPGMVARHVAAAIRGYRAAGIMAVAKHFPGHGAVEIDTHRGLAVLPVDLATLRTRELVPFITAVAAGAQAVMTAHIIFPALDAEHPATLSPAVLQGLLRAGLGFKGLVLTDCLEMEAIAARYDPEEYAPAAVRAGADLLLVSHRLDRQTAARDAIAAAIRRGALSRERVAASAARVLAAKERLGLYDRNTPPETDWPALLTAHGRLERTAAADAVTEVWNDGILPVRSGVRIAAVRPEVASRPRLDDPDALCPLGVSLRRYCRLVAETRFPAEPGEGDVRRVLDETADAEVVIAALAGTGPGQIEAQTRLVKALRSQGKPLVVLAVRGPYILAGLERTGAGLAVYDPGPAALEAAAAVITGCEKATGRLPVRLSGEE